MSTPTDHHTTAEATKVKRLIAAAKAHAATSGHARATLRAIVDAESAIRADLGDATTAEEILSGARILLLDDGLDFSELAAIEALAQLEGN